MSARRDDDAVAFAAGLIEGRAHAADGRNEPPELSATPIGYAGYRLGRWLYLREEATAAGDDAEVGRLDGELARESDQLPRCGPGASEAYRAAYLAAYSGD